MSTDPAALRLMIETANAPLLLARLLGIPEHEAPTVMAGIGQLAGLATEYVIGDRESLDPSAAVTVSWRRGDLWAVTRGRRIRNQGGAWEIEPIPSSRDDDFRARCYRPLPVAMAWARAILAAGAP